jgi:hypothetical protein
LTPRLQTEYHQLEPLFQSIFQWDPNERLSISAICKNSFFADAHPFQKNPSLQLPETERISKGNAYSRFMRGNARPHIQFMPQSAEVQVTQGNKPT